MIGKTIHIQKRDTVRLLSSARLRPPALSPLVDDAEEFELLVSLEYATHGRLHAETEGLRDLDSRELVFGVPNYSFINAAFAYPRPGGNRFNNGHRGAWYCGFEVETSLAEVSYHLSRALADADNAFHNVTDYAELFADFIGNCRDLRGLKPRPTCLDENPAKGYPAGQALAESIRKEGNLPAILYPSVRWKGGTCLAVLSPSAVQNVRQGEVWRLEWDGAPEPNISRIS